MMNTNKKETYLSTINAVLAAIQNQSFENITPEHVEKLIALGKTYEKHNTAKSTKPTKKQTDNMKVKEEILSKLSSKEGRPCSAIASDVGISTQKCSALLSQMVKSADVIKEEGKGHTSLFRLATAETAPTEEVVG